MLKRTLTLSIAILPAPLLLGKIRTIQLKYTDAKESLMEASQKATMAARGFRIQCSKWAIIVRLLLGEIPERTIFMQK
jgi:26S proteasome regulatory subunit N3